MKMRIPNIKMSQARKDFARSVFKALHAPSGEEVLFDALQIFGGIALFLIFANVSRGPADWWVPLVALAVAAASTYMTPYKFQYRLLLTTAILLSTLDYCLSQPLLTPLGWASGGLALAVIAHEWKYPGWKTLVRLFLLGTVLSAAVMTGLSLFALPFLHPYTVDLIGWLPAFWLVLTIIMAGLASLRQRAGNESHDWMVAPTMWILFAIYWGPSTLPGIITLGLVIAIQTYASYSVRPTDETTSVSHKGFKATAKMAGVWLGLIAISNYWDTAHDIEMANYKEVEYINELPISEVTRMVPKDSATAYCTRLHQDTTVDLSTEPALITVREGGTTKTFWECLRYPNQWQDHEILYSTGGMEGFVVADAGEFGPTGHPVFVKFILSDRSPLLLSAFYIRHPGAVIQHVVLARAKHGGWHMLITYTNKVMSTGGAIFSDAIGVMEVSPLGFLRDLPMEKAGREYPDAPLFPSKIARLFAEAWGRAPSIAAALYTNKKFMVSESKKEGNKYPFYETFKNGLKGVTAFEAQGNSNHQLAAFIFNSPVNGDMEIFRYPEDQTSEIINQGKSIQHPVGPAEIVSRIHLSHPGLPEMYTTEALPLFTEDHRVYWLTAMMKDEKQDDGTTKPSYARSVLYSYNGGANWDAYTVQQVRDSMKPGLPSQKPQDK